MQTAIEIAESIARDTSCAQGEFKNRVLAIIPYLDGIDRLVAAMSDPRREVTIDYTNWRGERSTRRVRPLDLVFENNEWHPETQWLLEAYDLERQAIRTFAVKNIHSWHSP